tara:strand:- start:2083 stop:2463 length:381 start_codon:yes stop_codon:yes gene_type:complete
MAPVPVVYCLADASGASARTYVGATIDLPRRLRQHNGEQPGGARATRGGAWRVVLTLEGLPAVAGPCPLDHAWRLCLSSEWRCKFHRRSPRYRRWTREQLFENEAQRLRNLGHEARVVHWLDGTHP